MDHYLTDMRKLFILLGLLFSLSVSGQMLVGVVSSQGGGGADYQNLLFYSEDLSNAYWVKQNVAILVDQENDLDGNTTLDRATTSDDYAKLFTTDGAGAITVSASTTYKFEFDCKRGTMDALQWAVYDKSNSDYIVIYDSYYAQTAAAVQRVVLEFSTPEGCTNIWIDPLCNSGTQGTVFIGRLQLRESSHPEGYIKTEGTIVE